MGVIVQNEVARLFMGHCEFTNFQYLCDDNYVYSFSL